MPEGFSIRQVQGDMNREIGKLRKTARRKLRAEMRRALVAETKPARAAIKKAARDQLPKRGGLNKWAAVTPSLRTTFTGDKAQVTIVMKKAGHDMKALDRGRLRHPLFGNRGHWYQQSVNSGFFSDTVDHEQADLRRRVTDSLLKSIDDL